MNGLNLLLRETLLVPYPLHIAKRISRLDSWYIYCMQYFTYCIFVKFFTPFLHEESAPTLGIFKLEPISVHRVDNLYWSFQVL